MNIQLNRIDDAFRMEASNERGDKLFSDGTSAIGASEQGWRPMELLLVSLAGCSSIDVISILKKQRQEIDDLKMDISGQRVDAIPGPYKSIQIHFTIEGNVKETKMEKAIELTKGKYCSVYFSLHPDITVDYTYTIIQRSLKS